MDEPTRNAIAEALKAGCELVPLVNRYQGRVCRADIERIARELAEEADDLISRKAVREALKEEEQTLLFLASMCSAMDDWKGLERCQQRESQLERIVHAVDRLPAVKP
jgi:hypothetical protein